jgi:hypothetical protein
MKAIYVGQTLNQYRWQQFKIEAAQWAAETVVTVVVMLAITKCFLLMW